MPPLRNGVDWANILSTGQMIATYKGKVVVNPFTGSETPWTIMRRQEKVDEYIANDTRWTDVLADGRGGPTINQLVDDGGQSITEWVLTSDVPADADSWIVQEPAFYYK